jgi:ABC-type multidrug transport system fused ATPase/permease subunit
VIRAIGKIDISIRQGVFSGLLKKKWTEVSKFHSGEILNRFTSDVDLVVDGVVGIVPSAISLGTRLVAGMAVLFAIDRKFTIAALALGVFIFGASKIYSKHFKYLHKQLQQANGIIRSFIQECVENLVVIKSFANDKNACNNLYKRQRTALELMYKKQRVSNIANTGVYLLFSGSYYAALVWGAIQISLGVVTFGTLTAFLQILSQIQAPMKNISGLVPQFYSMIASAERLMELEALPDEKYTEYNKSANEIYSEIQDLRIDNVTFAYKDNTVLQNTDVTIKKGELVAIAGPSGIGKSTLMKLFLGLIEPKKGKLYFRTKDGNLPVEAGIRKLFAYVPQGNMILSGTIRENISFCCPETDSENIIYAAKKAMLWDFICTLPDGMDTVIGERGFGLSEGQIQRIAVARAILSDAPILLLDEATSALDEYTEKELLKNIKELKNKTCIFISHKQKTLSECDRILYMENKNLVEYSMDDVMKKWD